jgi:hypothetical protein
VGVLERYADLILSISPLNRQTPDQAYINALTPMMVAA